MRKTIIVISWIIGVLLIGWVIFYFVNRPTTSPITTNQKTSSSTTQQAQQTQQKQPVSLLKVVSSNPVFDFAVSSSTQDILTVDQDGKIEKITQGQKNTFLSEQTINDLGFVLPSPDGQKIAVGFGNSIQPQLSIFNLADNSWSPLQMGIKSIAWSPEGKRLAATITGQTGRTDLMILDQTGKAPKTIIQNFSLQDLKMEWLMANQIFFSEKPAALAMGSAWRLDFPTAAKTTFTQIVAPGKGLLIKWLANNLGLKLQNQQSSLINSAGQTTGNISYLALPDKCAIKDNSLYCFLFNSNNSKTIWPDDYLKKAVYTQDNLYKFDLSNPTNKPTLVFDVIGAGKTIDASEVKISGNQIFFVNRYDNLLYSLDISNQ